VDLIDSLVASAGGSDANMISLLALFGNTRANVVLSIAGPIDSMTALLANDEVSPLGILSVLSVFPDAGDTRPAVDRFFVSRNLEVAKIPLCSTNGNTIN
jgi:hypothetical protein